MLIIKLSRSNKAHKRLYEHYDKMYNSSKDSTKKSFIAEVKRDYHFYVIKAQKDKNRVLSKTEKKDIFNENYLNNILIRSAVNKQCNWNQYVPKKYRKIKEK